MMLGDRARGEPLLVLGLLLVGWVGARAAVHYVLPVAPGSAMLAKDAASGERRAARVGHAAVRPAAVARPVRGASAPAGVSARPTDPVGQPGREPMAAIPAPALLLPAPPAPIALPPLPAKPEEAGRRIAVAGGHQLLWLAALAQMPLPADVAARLDAAPRAGTNATALPRWSADGWLFFRRGGSAITFPRISGGGTYGASQAGMVLRYRLAPADPHRPAIYVRGAAALNGTREQEAAVGLSARPVARLPVAAMVEVRATRDGQGLAARPAVALVTELPPQRLPLGFTGEAYVQAGYVGGRSASGFVDGLMRAERPLFTLPGANARAGAGAWGAKQRGAARLDVGPVASVTVRLGDTASARIEADWRFRVAGGAHPGSGPALTLSAGF